MTRVPKHRRPSLALTLFVFRILADDHDITLSADDLTFLADWFDGRTYFHVTPLLTSGIIPDSCALCQNQLLVPIGNSTTTKVIRGQLHRHAVAW